MGIAALSTGSFGAAVRRMARYKKLSAPEEILDDVKGDGWAVQFLWSLAVGAEPAETGLLLHS